MYFIDINTFYNPRAGGIRTYHQAKIEWFSEHPEHHYLLVGPAKKASSQFLAPNIEYLALPGWQATGDPEGYRALVNFIPLLRRLSSMPGAVIEIGDPWWSAWLFTFLRGCFLIRNPLTFFFHSEPIRTYLEPWSCRGNFQLLRRITLRIASRMFFAVFRQFQHIFTSSRLMETYLHDRNMKNTVFVPFGAPETCFQRFNLRERKAGTPIKLLYAGRLENDKDIQILIEAIPTLLEDESVSITVMGRGLHESFFQTFTHPRFVYMGYVEKRDVVESTFYTHDVLLAPGSWETFGLSVLEAMALGMPVIGPDQGGTWELLQNLSNPQVFKARCTESFIAAVERIKQMDLLPLSQDHHEVALRYGTWAQAMDRQMNYYLEYFGGKACAI